MGHLVEGIIQVDFFFSLKLLGGETLDLLRLDDGGVLDVTLPYGGIVLGATTRWRWQGAEQCTSHSLSTSILGSMVRQGLVVSCGFMDLCRALALFGAMAASMAGK
jgi:hypothetical protein